MFSCTRVVRIDSFVHYHLGSCRDEVFGDDTVEDDKDDEWEDVKEDYDHEEEADFPDGDGLCEALRVPSRAVAPLLVLSNAQDRTGREKEIESIAKSLKRSESRGSTSGSAKSETDMRYPRD